MARKPYPRIKLTQREYDVIQKLARFTRLDESWFSIAGDTVNASGKVVNKPRSEEYDECYDWHTRHNITLYTGIKLLNDSVVDSGVLNYLTVDEITTWNGLLAKLTIS